MLHHIGSLELGWKVAVGEMGLNQSHLECCFSRGIKGHTVQAGRVTRHLSKPVKSPLDGRRKQGCEAQLPATSCQQWANGFCWKDLEVGGPEALPAFFFHPATANKFK